MSKRNKKLYGIVMFLVDLVLMLLVALYIKLLLETFGIYFVGWIANLKLVSIIIVLMWMIRLVNVALIYMHLLVKKDTKIKYININNSESTQNMEEMEEEIKSYFHKISTNLTEEEKKNIVNTLQNCR